ncbi:MAG: hypothetical protein KW806_02280 [Candidatus Yanofskybacteria bacterium]|nr:hypothetical protein [Candidatus Yanofskybacteria bacterium]
MRKTLVTLLFLFIMSASAFALAQPSPPPADASVLGVGGGIKAKCGQDIECYAREYAKLEQTCKARPRHGKKKGAPCPVTIKEVIKEVPAKCAPCPECPRCPELTPPPVENKLEEIIESEPPPTKETLFMIGPLFGMNWLEEKFLFPVSFEPREVWMAHKYHGPEFGLIAKMERDPFEVFLKYRRKSLTNFQDCTLNRGDNRLFCAAPDFPWKNVSYWDLDTYAAFHLGPVGIGAGFVVMKLNKDFPDLTFPAEVTDLHYNRKWTGFQLVATVSHDFMSERNRRLPNGRPNPVLVEPVRTWHVGARGMLYPHLSETDVHVLQPQSGEVERTASVPSKGWGAEVSLGRWLSQRLLFTVNGEYRRLNTRHGSELFTHIPGEPPYQFTLKGIYASLLFRL